VFFSSFGNGSENAGTGNGYGYNSEKNGNGFCPTAMTIPIFTVTVNPLEADEMTYVPGIDSMVNYTVKRNIGCVLR
jgi:hypothetical protein